MKLEIENLSFSYPKGKVLDNLSVSFREGEFAVLLGRNGAGKTTLMKNLLGLLKPTSGRILIDGINTAEMKNRERARKLAYIPQESQQSFAYSVFSTVLMGTTAAISTLSTPGKAEEEKAMAALRRFGIEHLKDRAVNAVSGGERQLVLCARAIAQDADILLFDEPTSSLDWGNQIRVLESIRSLTEEGYTAIVSTHNLEQALNYASRIILMEDGHIKADCTPEEMAEGGTMRHFYSVSLEIRNIDGHYICIPEVGNVVD